MSEDVPPEEERREAEDLKRELEFVHGVEAEALALVQEEQEIIDHTANVPWHGDVVMSTPFIQDIRALSEMKEARDIYNFPRDQQKIIDEQLNSWAAVKGFEFQIFYLRFEEGNAEPIIKGLRKELWADFISLSCIKKLERDLRYPVAECTFAEIVDSEGDTLFVGVAKCSPCMYFEVRTKRGKTITKWKRDNFSKLTGRVMAKWRAVEKYYGSAKRKGDSK